MMRTIRIVTLLAAMFALMAPAAALAGHHENPCGEAKAENPCAENPCADNPCANPCGHDHADHAANPCSDNPCAAVKAPERKKSKSN